MNSCINRLLSRSEKKRESSFFSFVHYLYQFVVLVECKYHLYIFNKYKIDIDFFKQILFVLSMMQMCLWFCQSRGESESGG